MDEILISIKPVWADKVLNGEKTVEVRKNRPYNCLPFKCYIYQSKDRQGFGGVVVGEFICKRITAVSPYDMDKDTIRKMGTNIGFILAYADDDIDKILYLWEISNVIKYKQAKALSNYKSCHSGNPVAKPPISWMRVVSIY